MNDPCLTSTLDCEPEHRRSGVGDVHVSRSCPVPEETLDPKDWDEFRALAHEMLDWTIDLQKDVRSRPIWRPTPDDVAKRLREAIPKEGMGVGGALAEFVELVLPYPVGNTHPRFWGWATGTGTPTGVLADALAAALNPITGVFNDASTRVESQVLDWMKSALGFPNTASGIITSGGSVANLIALSVARDTKAGWSVAEEGVRSGPGRPVFYASTEVHSCVFKAARLLGLGQEAVRVIPVDACFRTRTEDLPAAIARDREAGLVPFAVVGTAGTINTGAIDDLNRLADIARQEDLWFHVDAAFGAMAALSPETRHLVDGMSRADSLAFDFHKWMYVPYEAGCVLIRDEKAHRESFTVGAGYLRPLPRGLAHQPDSTNLRGPQLSRGFKALKVWMTIKEHGIKKLGRLVAQNVRQARYFARLIDESPHFARTAPAPLNVVAFRHEPPKLDEETIEEINREVLMRLQERGMAVASSTVLNGRFTLRICICNHRSRLEDFEYFLSSAEEVLAEVRAEMGLAATG